MSIHHFHFVQGSRHSTTGRYKDYWLNPSENIRGRQKLKEMKRHLKSYVKNNLFKDQTLPAPTNQRFYPSNVTVKNHIYLQDWSSSPRLIKLSWEKIEEWKKECPRDSFYYRKYSDIKPDCDLYQQLGKLKDDADVTDDISIKLITSSNWLLFIYQSEWQKKILRRYGVC